MEHRTDHPTTTPPSGRRSPLYRRWAGSLALALLVAPMSGGTPVAAQEVVSLSGNRVAVFIPAGVVRVEAGSGTAVEVLLRTRGRDAGLIRPETAAIGGRNTLVVRYPSREDIVYPESRGRTDLRVERDGTFGGRGGDRIRVSGSGGGVEAWVEATVRIPAGRDVQIRVGAGDLEAQDVDATALTLTTGPGRVDVAGIRGDLSVSVGSGAIQARDISGGAVSLTTGSGPVEAGGVRGDQVRVRTGSGGIGLEGVAAGDLAVTTGSGRVEVDGGASGNVAVRTGSGSVTAHLQRAPQDLRVDTGSGGVTLHLPRDTGAQVEARTGSGGIDVELASSGVTSRRGRFTGTLGDGRGRIRVTTGSGSVRIRPI